MAIVIEKLSNVKKGTHFKRMDWDSMGGVGREKVLTCKRGGLCIVRYVDNEDKAYVYGDTWVFLGYRNAKTGEITLEK